MGNITLVENKKVVTVEELAYREYPKKMEYLGSHRKEKFDMNGHDREVWIAGFKRALEFKDL